MTDTSTSNSKPLTEKQMETLCEAIQEIVINKGIWVDKKAQLIEYVTGTQYESKCAEFMNWFENE